MASAELCILPKRAFAGDSGRQWMDPRYQPKQKVLCWFVNSSGFCPALSYADYQSFPTKTESSWKLLRSLCSYPLARNPEQKSPLATYHFQCLSVM